MSASMPSIIPDMSPYYVDDSSDIRKKMEESYRQCITFQQQLWNEGDIDTRFVCGDQTLWPQLYNQPSMQSRKNFQFNRIRRIKNLVSGYQRRNRLTSVVTPIENADQETADQLSATLQWANNQAGVYNHISDAFDGALTTGLNVLSVWMDYRSDPINGDIKVDNKYFNGVFIDPTFKKKDLSDANFIWTRKWVSKTQAISLLPDHEEEISQMPCTANRDDKFIFLPENYQYGIRGLLPYDEYWYLDYRPQKLLIDTQTGETKEWEGDNQALKMFLAMYPEVKVTTIQKQTCKLAICVNNKVLYNGPNPFGIDRYPFVGVYCYFEPEIPYFSLKIQGIVRGLRDSQYLYNRRMVISADLLESQINSGIKYKESALVDPKDAFLTGQGRALAIRDSASMDDVQKIPAPEIPASMFQLSEMFANELQQISGVNEELLGSANDDKAGVLSMLRQGAGLTTLQGVFDELDQSQKQLGSLFLDLIQANFTPAKIKRIIGKEPSQQFHSRAFQKYDCNVEEGTLTSSQRDMQFQQLLQLRELGLPIPNSILLNSAKLQRKQELIDAMDQEQQQAQQQQQLQSQIEMQNQQSVTESFHSKSMADQALAQERLAKIPLDQAERVERMQKAQEEMDTGTLNKIRALKELESMDVTHLQNLINVLNSIKDTEVSKQPTQSMVA